MIGAGTVVADIGGTNARFARLDDHGEPTEHATLPVAGFPGFVEAFRAYAGGAPIAAACVAVACPVDEDMIRLTNAPWAFSKRAVKAELGLATFDVINDFTAQALALPHLGSGDVVPVGPVDVRYDGRPLAVLGPGTGLGVSGLLPTPGGWVPISGEGGHVSIAARDAREWAIVERLTERYGRASAERILCGAGMTDLHTILAEIDGHPLERPLAAPEITAAALAGDSAGLATIATFLSMLGAVAGDLALTLGSFGGVYIAGGIVPRILPLVAGSALRESFLAKGRMRRILEPVPTFVVVAPSPALIGAAAHMRTEHG